jgi:hypothetical protein
MQSGIPELVRHGHNGLIQHGRDYAVWADAIIELHQDRDRLDRLSANAQQTIGEAYTVERIGDQFHQLLRRISTEIQDESYRRPPALTWGGKRAVYGDVLPPPLLYAPDERPWVAVAKPLWRALPTPVRDRLRRIAGSA